MTRPHGYARYKLDGCRCYTCAGAVSDYNQKRERAIAYGTWQPYVDAAPVREHIANLQASGLGLRGIANLAGVARQRLQIILYGRPGRGTPPQTRIRPAIAAAILAVEPTLDRFPDRIHVDGAGTRRRIQALITMGWSQAKLATRIGWTAANFTSLLQDGPVTAATARLVRDLYDQLWNQPPPETEWRDKIAASRARNYAAARRWLPPLAWDDDLIDIPDKQLGDEIARRVAAMDDDELRASWNARYQHGDRSPLIAAAALHYDRQKRARAKESAS